MKKMKMMIQSPKTKKFLKVFTTLAIAAAMMAVCTIVASAAGGGGGQNNSAENSYQSVIGFFVTWMRRLGAAVALIGAFIFGLAIKNKDPDQKETGLTTMIAGFVVVAITAAVNMFDLFS